MTYKNQTLYFNANLNTVKGIVLFTFITFTGFVFKPL